jgi:Divergent InlB B-repeat domain
MIPIGRSRPSAPRLLALASALALIGLLAWSAAPALASGVFADDFADAKYGYGGKDGYQSMAGNNKSATYEEGEPDHAGVAGLGSDWTFWTSWESRTTEISVCGGTAADTLLGVYTGIAVNALTEVASNDDDPLASNCSSVRFTAVAKTKYMIAVDSKAAAGTLWLRIRTVPPNDDFADATAISKLRFEDSVDNRIATVEAGEPKPGGFALGNTVWYRWTAPEDGFVSVDNCTFEHSDAGIAVYTGTAVNELTEVASNAGAGGLCWDESEVRFNAVEGTIYAIQVDGDPRYTELYLDFEWVPTRTFVVTRSGSGKGTVSSAPAGIECGLVCEAGFYRGPASDIWKTRVTLTATPAPGSAFAGWSDESCDDAEAVCELVREGTGVTVDAEFEDVTPELDDPPLPSGSSGSTTTPIALLPPLPSAGASPTPKRPKPKCAKRRGKGKSAKASKRRACKR